jgi:hypothetical protein
VAGQVCLEFSVLAWFPLTILCIMVDDWFDYYVLKEEPCPYYKINGKTIFKFKERKGSSNSYRP